MHPLPGTRCSSPIFPCFRTLLCRLFYSLDAIPLFWNHRRSATLRIAIYLVLAGYCCIRGLMLRGSERRLNFVNGAIFVMAIALSFLLRPSPAYVYFPIVLVVATLMCQRRLQSILKTEKACTRERGLKSTRLLNQKKKRTEEQFSNRLIVKSISDRICESGGQRSCGIFSAVLCP